MCRKQSPLRGFERSSCLHSHLDDKFYIDSGTQGVHTCDMRRSKTVIHDRYPAWTFEKGFAEHDPFWMLGNHEFSDAQQARAGQALVEILNKMAGLVCLP